MSTSSHNTFSREKSNTIQLFRALAIIAVVMIHTTPPGEWQVFCRPFINFAVATFLFLSGYLTKTENEDWGTFYKKRITRVLIPYLLWSTLYCIPGIIHYGLPYLFKRLLLADASTPMYYIFVYIQFVLITPLLGKLAMSKFRAVGWWVAPISILIFKYYRLLTGAEPNTCIQTLWSDACLGWFTFYYLGLLLGNNIIKKEYKLTTLFILYAVSIPLQMAEGYGWLLLGERNCGTQLKLTSLLTSSLFLLIVHTILKKKTNGESRFLCMIGDYSFGIYLCHIMVMTVLWRVPYYTLIPYPINSAIVVLVSLGCCYAGNKICGKRVSKWLGLI